MSVNIQKALGVASKFLGNDKIKQALDLSKNVKTPQDAIKVLSQLGDPNQIIDNGISKLNNPMAMKMAGMFGANEQQLQDLKNEILGLKGQVPQTTQQQQIITQKQTKQSSYTSRMQELLNGLK